LLVSLVQYLRTIGYQAWIEDTNGKEIEEAPDVGPQVLNLLLGLKAAKAFLVPGTMACGSLMYCLKVDSVHVIAE